MIMFASEKFTTRKIHYLSGLVLSVFIGPHLLNQLFALAGPGEHIQLMEKFRFIYRIRIFEFVLLAAVVFQIFTGIKLLFLRKVRNTAEKIQVYSGFYLSVFLIVHVTAVITGRLIEHLDTNFYYAAAGLNIKPAIYVFIPYYFLAVAAISAHVASLHYLKTRSVKWATAIGALGVTVSVLILFGFTNSFRWRPIPQNYQNFIYKYFGKRKSVTVCKPSYRVTIEYDKHRS